MLETSVLSFAVSLENGFTRMVGKWMISKYTLRYYKWIPFSAPWCSNQWLIIAFSFDPCWIGSWIFTNLYYIVHTRIDWIRKFCQYSYNIPITTFSNWTLKNEIFHCLKHKAFPVQKRTIPWQEVNSPWLPIHLPCKHPGSQQLSTNCTICVLGIIVNSRIFHVFCNKFKITRVVRQSRCYWTEHLQLWLVYYEIKIYSFVGIWIYLKSFIICDITVKCLRICSFTHMMMSSRYSSPGLFELRPGDFVPSSYQTALNPSPPDQNGRHFADDTFRCIFMNETFGILSRTSLQFVLKSPIDNDPSLV